MRSVLLVSRVMRKYNHSGCSRIVKLLGDVNPPLDMQLQSICMYGIHQFKCKTEAWGPSSQEWGWVVEERAWAVAPGHPGVRSVAQAACTPPVPAPAWHGARGRRMQWTHRPHRCKYEYYKL